MNSNLVVSTMPLKPQKETNIGMLLAPTIMDFLGDCFDCEKVMSMNSLNSYCDKNKELEIYINDIDKNSIKYNRVLVDEHHADEILSIIEKLYRDNYLCIKNKSKYICDCGKVDILESTLNSNAKLCHFDDKGNLVCNECGSICKKYNEKNLCLELKDNVDDTVSIAPLYLKKEMNGFSKQFKGNDFLVSKNRDTGYSLILDGIKFNIDVDFIWNNFFKLFEQDKQILLASNHQVLLMYLMNYLSRITSNKELTFVANPYVLNKGERLDQKYFLNDNEFYKKLFILYNLKWKQKDCNWSSSIIDYLSTISNTKLNNLYKTILYSSKEIIKQDMPLDMQIDKILIRGTNMQENIKLMKTLYKKGML